MNKIIDSFKIEESSQSRLDNYKKVEDETREIGDLYRPEMIQTEEIKMKSGKNTINVQ